MITITLFYFYEKVFMNIWVIRKFNEASLPQKEDSYIL